ncbi:MAG: tetratricopeptide repeat protein [bacterium]|nr:tetratricopeptide repeat protein [bacterium]
MKICYISPGRGTHIRRLTEWFAKRGHDIYLITDSDISIKDVRIYNLTQSNSDIEGIRYAIDEIKPDILHLQTLLYPSYLSLFLSFKPTVVTPWNGDVLWDAETSPAHKMMVRFILKNADLITCNSREMVNTCILLGADPNRTYLIQDGADLRYFHPRIEVEDLRRDLSLNGYKIVLSTRSLGENYNIDIIIKSIPLVLKKVPHVKFIFIWEQEDTGYKCRLNKLIQELHVEDNILFVGSIKDYRTVAKYYVLSDVFISISSYDSKPTSLLEAMACGTPPIVGDIPAVREWIEDKRNGYIVHPRDPYKLSQATIRLLNSSSIGKKFTKENLDLAKKADFSKNMEGMERLYLSLSNPSPKPHKVPKSTFYYLYGLYWDLEDDLKKAAYYYRKAIQTKPNLSEAHYLLGVSYRKQGRIRQAIYEGEKAAGLDEGISEYFSFLGTVYDKMGRVGESTKFFKRALSIDPKNIEATYYLKAYKIMGLVNYINNGYVNFGPNEVYLVPKILVEKGFFNEAFKEIEDIINSFFYEPEDFYFEFGILLLNENLIKGAAETFKRLISINQNHIKAHFNLGVCLENLGLFKDAIKSFQKVIEFEPDNALAHYNLGSCFEKEGRLKEAEREFSQVISLTKGLLSGAYYHLGIIKHEKELFKKCLKINPTHKMAKRFLEVNEGNT